jgi:hypothetical protein
MPAQAFRQSLLFLAATIAMAGCAAFPRTSSPETAKTPTGRIPIIYQWSDADRENPPAGFFVRRADSAAGPFTRLNEKPILPGKQSGAVVIFTDSRLPADRTFFYYLEVVDANGQVRKATPVVSAQVVIPEVRQSAPRQGAKPLRDK